MKTLELYSLISKKIETGALRKNEKLPNTLELAAQYGVSHTTVFRAMQLLLNEGLIQRVQSKGTFVKPYSKESYFQIQKAQRIGFLFRGSYAALAYSTFLGECFYGAEKHLKKNGKRLIPIPIDSRTPDEYFREINAQGVSGFIVNAIYQPAIYAAIKQTKLPFVCTDFLDYNLVVDQVTTDHFKAGSIATGKLLELGHKQILFFGNYHFKTRSNDPDHLLWWDAIQHTAKKTRLKNIKSCFLSQHDIPTFKKNVTNAILENELYTGYICASPAYYKIIRALCETDHSLKDRVRDMVVFSNKTDFLTINGRKVYQCVWDNEEMGKLAADLLCEIIEKTAQKPKVHYLPVEII
ncbi:MAG: GntR family transcriptional regulator [Fibrobacteres bacterium]|nr:GntR family transcriptional regulator [Fibrobacterota bacterium]